MTKESLGREFPVYEWNLLYLRKENNSNFIEFTNKVIATRFQLKIGRANLTKLTLSSNFTFLIIVFFVFYYKFSPVFIVYPTTVETMTNVIGDPMIKVKKYDCCHQIFDDKITTINIILSSNIRG